MNKKIDIIIPVYNAYEDLTKCIASIWKYTDLSVHRVVIVNDCSSDKRVSSYIHSIEGEDIVVIENKENKGFSGSVNEGIQYSKDNDVILLNSDTIVTANWIDKIIDCAYSESSIGTVTPLSNSATLASVPIAFQDNPVPENFTINGFAELIEKISFCDFPRITVAVGFCMFIKREVIEQVGLFDAKTFKRGYGEENDFCNRMELYGYKNVLCDNTFIFHKGTGSFDSEEKQKLIQQHEDILFQRYGKQMRNNAVFCSENPHQYIRDNINIYLKLKNGKKNILYVSHFDFKANSENNVGGIQYHVMDLVNVLKEEYNIYVLARDRNKLVLTAYCGGETTTFRFKTDINEACTVFSDDRMKKMMLSIMNAFRIDLIHIHHVLGLTFDAFYAAKELDIPIILTLHDYYYICPGIKLVNYEQQFFSEGCKKVENCKKCLQTQCGIAETVDYISHWRNQNRKVIELCNCVVAPSESAGEIYCQIYPELKNKLHIIEHGRDRINDKRECIYEEPRQTKYVKVQIEKVYQENAERDAIVGWAFFDGVNSKDTEIYLDVLPKDGSGKRYLANKLIRKDVDDVFNGQKRYDMSGFYVSLHMYDLPETETVGRVVIKYQNAFLTDGKIFSLNRTDSILPRKLNIAFLGGLSFEKGAVKVNDVICADRNREFNWFIFGAIANKEDMPVLEQDNVYAVGKYGRNEIFELTEKYHIDLICLLPIWGETFCYTLSEAYLCGIPVIVTDIGAVGERVRKIQNELVVPVNVSGETLLEKIRSITEDDRLLHLYREQVAGLPHKSVKEMGNEYNQLYKSYVGRKEKWGNFSAKIIYNGYLAAQEEKEDADKAKYSEISRMLQEEDNFNALAGELEQKEQEISNLKNSIWYRIFCRTQKIRFPFKSQIRNFLMRIVPEKQV